MHHDYSILLNVQDKPCLVIGGGLVAERKVSALLRAGAALTVISPAFSLRLQEWGLEGKLRLVNRAYKTGDVTDHYMLVFAATDSEKVNRQVYDAASALGLWVHVADRPELSTFILPSVVRRGKLILSVSTGGASPSLSRKIAASLSGEYGDEYEVYLDFLGELRLKVQEWVKDKDVRQGMFKQMLEWDVLAMIRSGTYEPWKKELLADLEQEPTPQTVAAFSRYGKQISQGVEE